MNLKDKEIDFSKVEELVKVGAINILALGYRGIDMWREKRAPLDIKKKVKDEKKA